jgi:signal transduction histidine kinase
MIDSADDAILGSALDDMTDEQLLNKIGTYSVYARVQPEHKVRIVKAWKAQYMVTAMTGDGVNDAPAIKIAEDAISAIKANEEATIPIELKWGEGVGQLSMQTNEQAAIRAVILLLDNAERFTKEGSITLTINLEENMVKFIVEDTGIGVPAQEAEHIFEEFVQLNEYEVGTGIGLTVARSICRRLGGDVSLDTTYTDGARFVIQLPIS